MKAEIMQEIKSTENTSCQPTALLFREHTLLDPLMIHILESIGYQLIYFEEVELPEINNLQPNIIILDDCLTTTSIALNINVIKTQINAPIIYLTKAYALQPNQDQIMQICDDFILKPFNPEELKFRIQCTIMRYGKKTKQQTIKHRQTSQASKTMTEPYFYIDEAARLIYIEDKPVHLSPKEYDLFSLLAEKSGQILSSKEIIEYLWGNSNNATSKDVQQYIYSLRKKIEKDYSNPCYVVNVPGFGYKLEDHQTAIK